MTATLGHRLARRDADRFVGRHPELARFDELLTEDDASASVVLVHGPSGIGKSTLLREVGRRADARGRPVHRIEGREIAPVPGELEAALHGVDRVPRPVVLIDTYERIAAAGTHLRRRVLPALPEGALVVIAGRRGPDPEWFQDGWEQVTTTLELGPLPEDDAHAFVERHGVTDDEDAVAVVSWAEGSPLALTVALEALGGGTPSSRILDERPDIAGLLVARIAGPELGAADRDVLAVAAVARVCTRELIADVLPDADAGAAERWLRRRTFSESVGGGIALHELLRRAIRTRERATRPDRERELRGQIADHLHARAMRGEPRLVTDLADLMDADALRWGFGAEGSVTHHIDGPRPGDADVVAAGLEGRLGAGPWRRYVEPMFAGAPEHVAIARDASDRLQGFCISATPAATSPVVRQDRILGPWLAHAGATYPDDDVLVWRDSTDLSSGRQGNVHSPVIAMMNTAAMIRSGLRNIRRSYLPIDPENPVARAFAEGVGAEHVPSLDVGRGDGGVIECHVLDHGEGGVLGQLRAVVHAEIDAAAGQPTPLRAVEGVADVHAPARETEAAPAITADSVRDALRRFHRPIDLATNALAPESGATAQRAAAVRKEIEQAIVDGFGESVEEQLLAATLRHGYLDPHGGHERAALDLNVSRATYFRKLREASDRVADVVLAARYRRG